jgi:OOP family OmpA-OmpF porin
VSGGAGVGVARVEFNNYRLVGSPAPFINASDTSVAFQAIAAVRKPITEKLDLGFKYSFFAVPNLQIDTIAGNAATTSFLSHSAMVSLTHNFIPVNVPSTR